MSIWLNHRFTYHQFSSDVHFVNDCVHLSPDVGGVTDRCANVVVENRKMLNWKLQHVFCSWNVNTAAM